MFLPYYLYLLQGLPVYRLSVHPILGCSPFLYLFLHFRFIFTGHSFLSFFIVLGADSLSHHLVFGGLCIIRRLVLWFVLHKLWLLSFVLCGVCSLYMCQSFLGITAISDTWAAPLHWLCPPPPLVVPTPSSFVLNGAAPHKLYFIHTGDTGTIFQISGSPRDRTIIYPVKRWRVSRDNQSAT